MRVLSSCTVFTKCFIVFACCKLGSNKMYLILFETNLAGDYSIIQYSTVLFLSLQGIDDLRTAVLKSELEMLSHAFISLVLSFEASTYIIKLLHPYFPSQVLRISDQGLLLILCTHLKSSLAKKNTLEQLTIHTLHPWLIWSDRHLSSLCVLFCVVLVFIGASIKHFVTALCFEKHYINKPTTLSDAHMQTQIICW